jgi:hypothetical protein
MPEPCADRPLWAVRVLDSTATLARSRRVDSRRQPGQRCDEASSTRTTPTIRHRRVEIFTAAVVWAAAQPVCSVCSALSLLPSLLAELAGGSAAARTVSSLAAWLEGCWARSRSPSGGGHAHLDTRSSDTRAGSDSSSRARLQRCIDAARTRSSGRKGAKCGNEGGSALGRLVT